MKIRIISLLILTSLIVGCTSVPGVGDVIPMDNNKYYVEIDRDYMDNPDEFKYAVNSFVKQKGGLSYDIEQYGTNKFYITIPGETPVEDLPEIKHLHAGRTVAAVFSTLGAMVLVTYIIGLVIFATTVHEGAL